MSRAARSDRGPNFVFYGRRNEGMAVIPDGDGWKKIDGRADMGRACSRIPRDSDDTVLCNIYNNALKLAFPSCALRCV